MIKHHPQLEVLVDYAAGSTHEPIALVVACHMSYCEACREQVRALEGIGGALLESLEPADVADTALEALLQRLDAPEARQVPPISNTTTMDEATAALIPPPLRAYVGGSLTDLAWRKVGRLYEEARLALSATGFKAALLRLQPGSIMPLHTHRGQEYTLVLAGGFKDGDEHFLAGDFDARDPSHKHQPVVDDDGECLCLVVLDAPVKLSGLVGHFVNPFLRI